MINILKAKKQRGKYNNKSCVSWVIQGNLIEEGKLIWDGESIFIGDKTGENE